MKPWPHGDPNAVVRGILASPAYRAAGPSSNRPTGRPLFAMLFDWFIDHIVAPIFRPLSGMLEAAHGFGPVIGVIIILVVLGLLAVAIFRLVVAFARPAGSRISGAAGDRTTLATTLSSAAWRTRAASYAAAGDYGRAIATLFTAAIVALDERAIVAFDPARTPGEYRRLVRRASAAASEPFDELTAGFVRAAYAEVVTTPQDFAAAERAFLRFAPAVTA